MTLGAADIRVHWRRLEGPGADEYDRAWDLLSPEERTHARRFVFAADRERYVIAHAFVRRTLSRYGPRAPQGWHFVSSRFGKPAIAPACGAGDLHFNLSHTDGLIACAVALRPIGVDVETIDRRVSGLDIASRFFSREEVAWLRAHPENEQPARFVELWTLKEAYVKGLGVGLSCPLNSFGFDVETGGAIRFRPPTDATGVWHFSLYRPTPRHRLALAVELGDSTGGPDVGSELLEESVDSRRPTGAVLPHRCTPGASWPVRST